MKDQEKEPSPQRGGGRKFSGSDRGGEGGEVGVLLSVPLLLLFSSRITICHSTLVLSKEEKWGGDQCAPTSLFFEGGALNQDALVFPPSLFCLPSREMRI